MVDLGELSTEPWGFPINGRDIVPVTPEQLRRFEILRDAMDLIVDLWPKPGFRTVEIETHQWVKLRRVLLSIPDLMIQQEDGDA